jgi:acetyl esterase/lipase
VEDLHIPPENILLAGDSAGGGLCLALLMYLRDNNYPMPSGAILMSPWVGKSPRNFKSDAVTNSKIEDLTMSCESWDSNAAFDVVPFPAQDDQLNPIALYLGERMEEYITHPYASPLFGNFKGLPPLLIQAGDAEVLRDEVTLLAHKATLAGVEVQHELYEDAVRCGFFCSSPLTNKLLRSMFSIHSPFSPPHVAPSALCATLSETSFLIFAVAHLNS